LKPSILIGGSCKPTNAIYLLFKNITSIHAKCDVFEKKIDVNRGFYDPPIKIGGFKMIDVLIAQVGFIQQFRISLFVTCLCRQTGSVGIFKCLFLVKNTLF
jgi:hypothetical protein